MTVESKGLPMKVVYDARHLSHYNYHDQAPLWWGFWGIILIETTVFATLITSYFYLNLSYPEIPPAGVKKPDLLLPTISSIFLFSSSYTMHKADSASEKGDNNTLKWFLIFSILLAAAFLVLKYFEYSNVEYRWDSHAYGSVVWAIIAFHSTHVVSLVLKTIFVAYLSWRGYFNKERHLGVTVNGIYWHFVVAVWLPLYLVLYWSPRLF
jgi:cytochrome c oxidase subunit III